MFHNELKVYGTLIGDQLMEFKFSVRIKTPIKHTIGVLNITARKASDGIGISVRTLNTMSGSLRLSRI